MAFRREVAVVRIITVLCALFMTTCHHRYLCHAFFSHSYTSTRPLNGDGMSSIFLPSPSQSKNNVSKTVRQRQHELLGHVTGEVEIRSRPNIFVIKTHEDYVKFLEEDDRLCVISELLLFFT